MAQTDPEVILDISTLVKRKAMRVNGRKYAVRTSDEFSYLAFRRHATAYRRMSDLMGRFGSLKEKEEKELSRLLDQACRQILIAPPAVHDKLTDTNRWDLFVSFSGLLRPKPIAGAPMAHQKNGTKRSRG